MSYTKQNWQSGDTITATKLNHIVVVGSANGAYRCDFGYFGSSEAMSFTATSADGYQSATLG